VRPARLLEEVLRTTHHSCSHCSAACTRDPVTNTSGVRCCKTRLIAVRDEHVRLLPMRRGSVIPCARGRTRASFSLSTYRHFGHVLLHQHRSLVLLGAVLRGHRPAMGNQPSRTWDSLHAPVHRPPVCPRVGAALAFSRMVMRFECPMFLAQCQGRSPALEEALTAAPSTGAHDAQTAVSRYAASPLRRTHARLALAGFLSLSQAQTAVSARHGV
jgi:hypothetical protein